MIAVFTALCVECTSLSVPLARAEVIPQSAPSLKKLNPEFLKLPTKFGEVVESYSGKGSVIVIQDAHAIPDAQRNIANIIKYLQQEYGVGAVALEGASGDLDPQIFRSFPDKKLLRQVMKGYMDAGEIAGGTAAAVFDETKTQYYGVEDWAIYEEGLGLYLQSIEKESAIHAQLSKLKEQLSKEKESIYPQALLEVDRKVESFYENAAQLTDLIKVLGAVRAPESGSELEAVWKEVSKAESPKSGGTSKDIEVRELTAQVEKVLKSPRAVKVFNTRKQEWMTGEISAEAFALHLKEFADQSGLNLEMSSDLLGMVRDQQTLKGLEGTKLFRDLEIYIREIKERLTRRQQTDVSISAINFEKSAIQALDERTESLRMLTKLSKLELSREEWKKLSGRLIFETFSALGLKQDDFIFHLAFYLNAEERDQIFFDNLKAPVSGLRPTVIVAGGFHAEGITSRLKEAGMGYALVMPKINYIPESINYRSQMRGEVSWKDYFEVENGRIHLYKAFVRATRDKLLHGGQSSGLSSVPNDVVPDVQMLKAWRDQIIRDLSDQGKVDRAAWYTRYMDEVIDSTIDQRLKTTDQLMMKVDGFIRGLRGLEKANQLNSEQIAALLRANMIQAAPIGGALAENGFVPANVEVTPDRAEEIVAAGLGGTTQAQVDKALSGKAVSGDEESLAERDSRQASDEKRDDLAEVFFEAGNLLLPKSAAVVQKGLDEVYPGIFEISTDDRSGSSISFHRDRFKEGDYLEIIRMLFTYAKAVAVKSGRNISVLDFNLGASHEAEHFNFVNETTMPAVRNLLYHNVRAQTSDVAADLKENREKVFEAWLDSARKAGPGYVFHIDHHYPSKFMSTTSTSRLLADFIRYAWEHGGSDVLDKMASETIAVADHSDPDILISNFLMRHANDRSLLTHLDWMADAAIYNDYQILRGEPVHQGRVRVFYSYVRGIDESIKNSEMSYSAGMAAMDAGISFSVQYGGKDSGAADALYQSIAANADLSFEQSFFVKGFKDEMESDAAIREVFRKPPVRGDILNQLDEHAVSDGFWAVEGDVLLFSAGQKFPVSGPDLARNIYMNEFPGSGNVKLLIVLKSDFGRAGYQIKLQILVDEKGQAESLRPLVAQIQPLFPNAGGRATAGSLGFQDAYAAKDAVVNAQQVATAWRSLRSEQRSELKTEPLVRARSENREYAGEIFNLSRQHEAAVALGNIALADQLAAMRLETAKKYVWEEIGSENPLIAKVVFAYLESENVTDLQGDILRGGAIAAKKISQVREVARFERQSMATGWMESPDKRMRHTKSDAIDLEAEIARVSRFYDSEEQALVNDNERNWEKDTLTTQNRREHEKWKQVEGSKTETVLNEAAALEPVMVLLLRHIAFKAKLSGENTQLSNRVKSKKSALNKIAKNRSHPEWGDWARDFDLAGLFDLLGGRFVVSDLATLEDLMVAIDSYFNFKVDRDTAGRPLLAKNSSVIRKENKFITNRADPAKPDPYRAVQYTIGFPKGDRLVELIQEAARDLGISKEEETQLANRALAIGDDAELHSFELQIKTEKGSMASDMWHDIGFKDLMGMGAFKETVDDYNWNSLFEDLYVYAVKRKLDNLVDRHQEYEDDAAILEEALNFAREKNWSPEEQQIAAKAILQAISSNDINRFYDLVLSSFGAGDVLPESARVLIRRLFDREKQKLVNYKKEHTAEVLTLEKAAHRGYVDSAVGDELGVAGNQLGWKLPDEAVAMLSPSARERYINRYKTFKKSNKLTVEDLELLEMNNGELQSFFEAAGKILDWARVMRSDEQSMTSVEKLVYRIISARDSGDIARKLKLGKTAVMNLFHAPHQQQIDAASTEFSDDPDLRSAWISRLETNQLGTVTSASILTEIVNRPVLDLEGLPVRAAGGTETLTRDLAETVVSVPEQAQSFSRREMMIFWFFISAINPGSSFASESYENFCKNPDNEWAVKIDGAMDRAVTTALIQAQLDVLRNRIATAQSNIRVATDITLRRELIEKYLRSVGIDVQVLERWLNYLDEKYAMDTQAFLSRDDQLNESQQTARGRVVQFAQRSLEVPENAARVQARHLDAAAETVAEMAGVDLIEPLLPYLDWSLDDIRRLKPDGAEQRIEEFRNEFELYVVRAMKSAKKWLDTKMNQRVDETGIELTPNQLNDFYWETIEPLKKTLESVPDPQEWNEATWEAYRKWATGDKWDDAKKGKPTAQLTQEYAAEFAGANLDVLSQLIEIDRMVGHIESGFMSSFTPREKEIFAEAVHDYGYYAQQSNRALTPSDYLLPVEFDDDGGIQNTFLTADGGDLLQPQTREAFDKRNQEPGKANIPKVSLAGLRLEGQQDIENILQMYRNAGKVPESIQLEIEVEGEGKKQISLPDLLNAALTDGRYRKGLGAVEIFNGFVRPWKKMLNDAEKNFQGEAYGKQIKFLYGKQYSAIASVLLATMIPTLLTMQMHARSDIAQKRFVDEMNAVENVLWRVTNPWLSWKESPLIRLGLKQLDAAQRAKDEDIWRSVLKLYLLTLARLGPTEYGRLRKAPMNQVFQRNNLDSDNFMQGSEPADFYENMRANGTHFIGVTTASGKGISTKHLRLAKEALRQAFRNIMAQKGITDPKKITVVSGGTGNWEAGIMSGVDLVYEVAAEMGFQTMAIFPTDAFEMDFPLRDVNYYLHTGNHFGEESPVFQNFTDSLITMAGGDQAYDETIASLPVIQKKGGIAYLIQGIQTERINKKTGKQDAVTDADEIRLKVLTEGSDGSVVSIFKNPETLDVDKKKVRFLGVSSFADNRKRTFVSPTSSRPARLFDEMELGGVAASRSEARGPMETLKILQAASQIQVALRSYGGAVVLGAGGMGKSEHIKVALAGRKTSTFDLRERFIKHKIATEGYNWDYWSALYRGDPSIKEEEAAWISDELRRSNWDGEVVVFDEVDLLQKTEISTDELATLRVIMDFAAELNELGKPVVFVMHENGMNSSGVLDLFTARNFLRSESDIIRPGYLSPHETRALLETAGFEAGDEFETYQTKAAGIPTAYLSLLEYLEKQLQGETPSQPLVLSSLYASALDYIQQNYRGVKRRDPKVLQELRNLASGKSIDMAQYRQALLATGLVGEVGDQLVMPEIVVEAIQGAEPLKEVAVADETLLTKDSDNMEDVREQIAKGLREDFPLGVEFDDAGIPQIPGEIEANESVAESEKLWFFGPNEAEDAVVARVNPLTGQTEFLFIQRKDNGKWAFPGGMVNRTLKAGKIGREPNRGNGYHRAKNGVIEGDGTAIRELFEETKLMLSADVIQGGGVIYDGAVQDHRNEKDRWMTTRAYLFVVMAAEQAAQLDNPKFSDDAVDARWFSLEDALKLDLHGSHRKILDNAAQAPQIASLRSELRAGALSEAFKQSGLNEQQLNTLKVSQNSEMAEDHLQNFSVTRSKQPYLLGASVPLSDEIPPLHRDVYEAYREVLGAMDWRGAYQSVGVDSEEMPIDMTDTDVRNAKSPEFLARMIQQGKEIIFLMPTNIKGHRYVENELRLLLDFENNQDLMDALRELKIENPRKALESYLRDKIHFVFGARQSIPRDIFKDIEKTNAAQIAALTKHFNSLSQRSEARGLVDPEFIVKVQKEVVERLGLTNAADIQLIESIIQDFAPAASYVVRQYGKNSDLEESFDYGHFRGIFFAMFDVAVAWEGNQSSELHVMDRQKYKSLQRFLKNILESFSDEMNKAIVLAPFVHNREFLFSTFAGVNFIMKSNTPPSEEFGGRLREHDLSAWVEIWSKHNSQKSEESKAITGAILFYLAIRSVQSIPHLSERSGRLVYAQWRKLADDIENGFLDYQGKRYEIVDFEFARLTGMDGFLEGKNPAIKLILKSEDESAQREIILKLGVPRPVEEEFMLAVQKKINLPSYHAERSLDVSEHSKGYQMIEFLSGASMIAAEMESGIMGGNVSLVDNGINLFLSQPDEIAFEQLRNLGGHLGVEYVLGAADSKMKHFLQAARGIIKIDSEYVLRFDETNDRGRPFVFQEGSGVLDFLNLLAQKERGKEYLSAIEEGFNRALSDATNLPLNDQSQALGSMFQAIHNERKKPVEPTLAEIQRRSEKDFIAAVTEGGQVSQFSDLEAWVTSPRAEVRSVVHSEARDSVPQEFIAYLKSNNLDQYFNIQYPPEIIEALLKDSMLRPVFLIRVPTNNLGPVQVVDGEMLNRIGGKSVIENFSAFQVGDVALADQLAGNGSQILVGVTDRPSKSSAGQRSVANGRQAYFPLQDGSWLGVKGSGLYLERDGKQSSLLEKLWLLVSINRWWGTASFAEAKNAAKFAKIIADKEGHFISMLGYRRLFAMPDNHGRMKKLWLLRGYFGRSLIFNRVRSPHRLSKLREVLKSDPDLKHLRESMKLPGRQPLSPKDWFFMLAEGFGAQEAAKQRAHLAKETLHDQDYTLAAEEVDIEELIPFSRHVREKGLGDEERRILLNHGIGLQGLENKLQFLAGLWFSKRYKEATEDHVSKFVYSAMPSLNSLFKVMMQSYFKGLDDQSLESWSEESLYEDLGSMLLLERFAVDDEVGKRSDVILLIRDWVDEERSQRNSLLAGSNLAVGRSEARKQMATEDERVAIMSKVEVDEKADTYEAYVAHLSKHERRLLATMIMEKFIVAAREFIKPNDGRRARQLPDGKMRRHFVLPGEDLTQALKENGFLKSDAFTEHIVKPFVFTPAQGRLEDWDGYKEHAVSLMRVVLLQVADEFLKGYVYVPEASEMVRTESVVPQSWKRFMMKMNRVFGPIAIIEIKEILLVTALTSGVVRIVSVVGLTGLAAWMTGFFDAMKVELFKITFDMVSLTLVIFFMNQFLEKWGERIRKHSERQERGFYQDSLLRVIRGDNDHQLQRFNQNFKALEQMLVPSDDSLEKWVDGDKFNAFVKNIQTQRMLRYLRKILLQGMSHELRYAEVSDLLVNVVRDSQTAKTNFVGIEEVAFIVLEQLEDYNHSYLMALKKKWQRFQKIINLFPEYFEDDNGHFRPWVGRAVRLMQIADLQYALDHQLHVRRYAEMALAEDLKAASPAIRGVAIEKAMMHVAVDGEGGAAYDLDYGKNFLPWLRENISATSDLRRVLASYFLGGALYRLQQISSGHITDKEYIQRILSAVQSAWKPILNEIVAAPQDYGFEAADAKWMRDYVLAVAQPLLSQTEKRRSEARNLSQVLKMEGISQLRFDVEVPDVSMLISEIEKIEGVTGLQEKRIERRGEGLHLTLINPTESGMFKKNPPSEEAIEQLRLAVVTSLKNGAIKISGVGKREKGSKKVYYLAVDETDDIYKARAALGLNSEVYKLHITLGFVDNDVFDQVKNINEEDRILTEELRNFVPQTVTPAAFSVVMNQGKGDPVVFDLSGNELIARSEIRIGSSARLMVAVSNLNQILREIERIEGVPLDTIQPPLQGAHVDLFSALKTYPPDRIEDTIGRVFESSEPMSVEGIERRVIGDSRVEYFLRTEGDTSQLIGDVREQLGLDDFDAYIKIGETELANLPAAAQADLTSKFDGSLLAQAKINPWHLEVQYKESTDPVILDFFGRNLRHHDENSAFGFFQGKPFLKSNGETIDLHGLDAVKQIESLLQSEIQKMRDSNYVRRVYDTTPEEELTAIRNLPFDLEHASAIEEWIKKYLSMPVALASEYQNILGLVLAYLYLRSNGFNQSQEPQSEPLWVASGFDSEVNAGRVHVRDSSGVMHAYDLFYATEYSDPDYVALKFSKGIENFINDWILIRSEARETKREGQPYRGLSGKLQRQVGEALRDLFKRLVDLAEMVLFDLGLISTEENNRPKDKKDRSEARNTRDNGDISNPYATPKSEPLTFEEDLYRSQRKEAAWIESELYEDLLRMMAFGIKPEQLYVPIIRIVNSEETTRIEEANPLAEYWLITGVLFVVLMAVEVFISGYLFKMEGDFLLGLLANFSMNYGRAIFMNGLMSMVTVFLVLVTSNPNRWSYLRTFVQKVISESKGSYIYVWKPWILGHSRESILNKVKEVYVTKVKKRNKDPSFNKQLDRYAHAVRNGQVGIFSQAEKAWITENISKLKTEGINKFLAEANSDFLKRKLGYWLFVTLRRFSPQSGAFENFFNIRENNALVFKSEFPWASIQPDADSLGLLTAFEEKLGEVMQRSEARGSYEDYDTLHGAEEVSSISAMVEEGEILTLRIPSSETSLPGKDGFAWLKVLGGKLYFMNSNLLDGIPYRQAEDKASLVSEWEELGEDGKISFFGSVISLQPIQGGFEIKNDSNSDIYYFKSEPSFGIMAAYLIDYLSAEGIESEALTLLRQGLTEGSFSETLVQQISDRLTEDLADIITLPDSASNLNRNRGAALLVAKVALMNWFPTSKRSEARFSPSDLERNTQLQELAIKVSNATDSVSNAITFGLGVDLTDMAPDSTGADLMKALLRRAGQISDDQLNDAGEIFAYYYGVARESSEFSGLKQEELWSNAPFWKAITKSISKDAIGAALRSEMRRENAVWVEPKQSTAVPVTVAVRPGDIIHLDFPAKRAEGLEEYYYVVGEDLNQFTFQRYEKKQGDSEAKSAGSRPLTMSKNLSNKRMTNSDGYEFWFDITPEGMLLVTMRRRIGLEAHRKSEQEVPSPESQIMRRSLSQWRATDFYAVLGFQGIDSQEKARAISVQDVVQAFRDLARSIHPDKVADAEQAAATARFQAVNDAYAVLGDPQFRAQYDRVRFSRSEARSVEKKEEFIQALRNFFDTDGIFDENRLEIDLAQLRRNESTSIEPGISDAPLSKLVKIMRIYGVELRDLESIKIEDIKKLGFDPHLSQYAEAYERALKFESEKKYPEAWGQYAMAGFFGINDEDVDAAIARVQKKWFEELASLGVLGRVDSQGEKIIVKDDQPMLGALIVGVGFGEARDHLIDKRKQRFATYSDRYLGFAHAAIYHGSVEILLTYDEEGRIIAVNGTFTRDFHLGNLNAEIDSIKIYPRDEELVVEGWVDDQRVDGLVFSNKDNGRVTGDRRLPISEEERSAIKWAVDYAQTNFISAELIRTGMEIFETPGTLEELFVLLKSLVPNDDAEKVANFIRSLNEYIAAWENYPHYRQILEEIAIRIDRSEARVLSADEARQLITAAADLVAEAVRVGVKDGSEVQTAAAAVADLLSQSEDRHAAITALHEAIIEKIGIRGVQNGQEVIDRVMKDALMIQVAEKLGIPKQKSSVRNPITLGLSLADGAATYDSETVRAVLIRFLPKAYAAGVNQMAWSDSAVQSILGSALNELGDLKQELKASLDLKTATAGGQQVAAAGTFSGVVSPEIVQILADFTNAENMDVIAKEAVLEMQLMIALVVGQRLSGIIGVGDIDKQKLSQEINKDLAVFGITDQVIQFKNNVFSIDASALIGVIHEIQASQAAAVSA